MHKFAEKYHFKGCWDATGKIMKQRIFNNESKYERCATAFGCYVKLRTDMIKNGQEQKMMKLLEYESNNDEWV